jgi:outer membrane receptor for ferrienterochelin and colicins
MLPLVRSSVPLTLLAAAAGLCCAAGARAQAQPDTPRLEAPTKLERVEVKATQRSDEDLRRQSTAAKIVFSRDELTRYGDTNVSDVLKRLPGVNMQGGAPRMRGLGAGFTLILINGEPAPPGFSLDNLSPSQIERVEVTRGPSAENSAQAVAGTINIILKEAPRHPQREWRGGLNLAQGHATPWINATYGDKAGDLSYSLPVSAYRSRFVNESAVRSQGFDAEAEPLVQRARYVDDGQGQGFNLSPRLSWRLGDNNNLSWQSFVNQHDWWSTGSNAVAVEQGDAALSRDEHYASTGRWRMLRSNLQWTRNLPADQSLDLRVGGQAWTRDWRSDLQDAGSAERRPLDQHSRSHGEEQTLTSSVKYKRPLLESHSLALGAEAEWRRREDSRSQLDNGSEQLPGFDVPFKASVRRSAIYAQDEWDISPQWSSSLGVRGENIETSADGPNGTQRNVSRVVTPLLHVAYKPAKSRDVMRASLTRSYRAPNLNQLLVRPGVNSTLYPTSGANNEGSPDRIGNPNLRPELALGLDLAYEKYLATGGLLSVSAFHRRIDGLIRASAPSLETVSWAEVPRWVSRPVNLSGASTSGVEMEAKGRAGELFPRAFETALPLDLRASLSLYRSSVDGIPGPDNRLEGQQPYSLNLGFDYRLSSLPLNFGASMAFTPGYAVQQSVEQRTTQSQSRKLDAYAQWRFSSSVSLRLSVRDLLPLDEFSTSSYLDVQSSQTERSLVRALGLQLEVKL